MSTLFRRHFPNDCSTLAIKRQYNIRRLDLKSRRCFNAGLTLSYGCEIHNVISTLCHRWGNYVDPIFIFNIFSTSIRHHINVISNVISTSNQRNFVRWKLCTVKQAFSFVNLRPCKPHNPLEEWFSQSIIFFSTMPSKLWYFCRRICFVKL